jgi:hypothetical protein
VHIRFAWLGFVLFGCAAGEPARSDGDFIGGEVAGNRFPATVRLVLPLGAQCGAAKLGPRRFLTASHCITQGLVAEGRSMAIVGGAAQRRVDTRVVRVVSSPFDAAPTGATTPAELSAKSGLDAAILEVDADTPDVGIARFDRNPLAAGDEGIVSGSGCDSDALSAPAPAGATPNTFRFAFVRIESAEKYHYYLPRSDINGRESRVCPGDSGTPVYKSDGSARPATIVGINSFRAIRAAPPIWGAVARIDTEAPDDARRWLNENVFGEVTP